MRIKQRAPNFKFRRILIRNINDLKRSNGLSLDRRNAGERKVGAAKSNVVVNGHPP